MPKCVFDRTTGIFTSGARFDDVSHDPQTHVQIELPEFPDGKLHRWDGANGIRDATAQELQAAIEAKRDVMLANFNGPLLSVVQATYELVKSPLSFATQSDFRQRILEIYRGKL